MAQYLTHDLIEHLIVFQAVVLLILMSNLVLIRQVRKHGPPQLFPSVSILVPARNEENNIASCVQSLLAQDYPSFELIVLNDQSEDGTGAILAQIATKQQRLKIINGETPPMGQVGKIWACTQLVRQSQGELLFFTDADTVHQPGMLRAIVSALLGEQADLLSGFPRQKVQTWGEKLLVPFFSWALLCFIPLSLVDKLKLSGMAIAVGQIMLFRRESYLAIGGHASVADPIVDDLSLARRIQAAGMRWRVIAAADLISCRMYQKSRDAIDGFSKNLFAAFGFRILPFLFIFSWLAVMFWTPLIVLALRIAGQIPDAQPAEYLVCIGLSFLLWFIPYTILGIPRILAFLYPVTILANIGVAIESLRRSLFGQLSWKGRLIHRTPWRWM
jgi:chlorobactene glucosyltransferase